MYNQVVNASVPNLPIHIGYSCSSHLRKICEFHYHDEIELLSLSTGKMSCVTKEKTYIISAGEILFINSRVAHETYILEANTVSSLVQINADEYTSNSTIKYLSRFLLNGENEAVLFDRKDQINKELSGYIGNIVKEYTEKGYAYDIYIKANIYNILAFLYRQKIIINPEYLFNTNKIINILPALQYIEQHFQGTITLDIISQVLNLNPYYFCRIFKKATNSTFIEYLNFVRVCKAEKMLSTTAKNIMEVSLEAGFSSLSYFNRIFKRYKNCTPTEYRKIKYSLK